jgi:serine protease AprX
MARITINGITLDPLARPEALIAAGLRSTDASTSDHILIQTGEPLGGEQRAQLTDAGVEIQEYVPESTYLCRYAPADLERIRALPFVTWADVYFRGFKIAPSLRPAGPAPATSLLASQPRRSQSRVLHQVDVVLHDGVDADASGVKEQIAAAAGRSARDLRTGRFKVRVAVEERRLEDLAALDEVRQIEPVPERQLFNNVARPIINADVLVNGTPYRGDGEVLAVADTGFDKGSTSDVHPAFTGRVARLYALGRPSPAAADDPDGHGTHVAGSALGDGTSSTMGGAIQGTAPEARLVLQSTLDAGGTLGGLPADLHDLFEPPYDDDAARVHTNSWGAREGGLPYDASAREIDEVVWSRPDLVICFAAGNQGADTDANGVIDAGTVGSQSAAKNCITVGASESVRTQFEDTYGTDWPSDFPANPIQDDRVADDADGMAAFSARGPTKEGRFKPDVVAPGTYILSTLSRAVASPGGWGTSSDPDFFWEGGTSMATPLVAGCTAVLRETLVKNGTASPSAALIKALLINGAVELPGQYAPSEAGPSPNNDSGFGRVDLAGSVIIPGPDADGGFGEGGPLKQGEEDTIRVSVPEGGRHRDGVAGAFAATGARLKVTLVWTDPPGAALQNDLDLIVRARNGDERHGNMGTSERFDRANNVEQVVWDNVPPGDAEIVVRAFRITALPQPYAYAWRIS